MGKASRTKRTGSARERIAAQRAAARRTEIRNRVLLASGAVVVVVAIVVTFVVVKANSKSSADSGSATGTALSAGVIHDITSVPAATLDTVGAGTTYPKPIIRISGPHLTSDGKPEVLYIGAEYCPYCATERWAMAAALSRFGTFTGLHGIHSSSTDVYPSTPTLTFYKSQYKSPYVTFSSVEETTVQKAPLQKATSQQAQLAAKYDAPPYVPQNSAGSIPFIDFGNQFMISGASYNPQVLQGKTWAQVAAALHDPSNPIAQGADGAANVITATICKMTNNQPASACTPAIKALGAKLG
jgi:thiol-disulfide isomerase/thioredoxin